MKRSAYPLLCAVLCGGFAALGAPGEEPPASWGLEPQSHAFGSISDVVPVQQDFLVLNRGDRDLRIFEVKLSCELCLSYSLSNERIPPGDVAVLSVRFNPLGYTGEVELNARIVTDDPAAPARAVHLTADVVPAFDVVGGPLVFSELEKAEVRSLSVRIFPAAPLREPLRHAASDYEGISVRVEPEAEGDAYIVTVTTRPPQPREGLIHCKAVLLSSLEAPPVYAIPVAMEVIPDFHVAPQRLVLDATDQEQFRILFVRQSVDSPAALLDVRVPDERFSVEIIPELALPNYRINVYSYALSGEDGEVGRIELVTDRPMRGSVSIPVIVRGQASGVDAVRPNSADIVESGGGPLCFREPQAPSPESVIEEILGAFPRVDPSGPDGWPGLPVTLPVKR